MTALNNALDRKIRILSSQDILLKKAREFYSKGYTPSNLTASQMNAVGNLIEKATSFEKASDNITKFLNKQIEKLRYKAESRGVVSSWLVPAKDESGKALGELFIGWVAEGHYSSEASSGDDELRLAVLQIFWVYLYGHYSYEKTIGKRMQIEEVKRS